MRSLQKRAAAVATIPTFAELAKIHHKGKAAVAYVEGMLFALNLCMSAFGDSKIEEVSA
jgi:hypothetical protein